MKVLILSCGTGGGHNDTGLGMKESFEKNGHEVTFLNDYIGMASQGASSFICQLYIQTVQRMPVLFNAVYHIGRVVSSAAHYLKKKSPVYLVNSKMGKTIQEILLNDHYDVILMPHLYPAETITSLRRKMKLPLTIAVGTDYTSIPFWEETNCDYYVVPSKSSARDFARRGIPKKKIIPMGIPAPIQFQSNFCKKDSRNALGFQDDHQYILVMGGSMGAGKIVQFISILYHQLKPIHEVIIICGTNVQLMEKLQKEYEGHTQIHVNGYCDNVALYMQACDLLFTKPGGLSSTESAISRIPTVFLKPISACEEANEQFFVKNGMAYAPEGMAEKVAIGLHLLEEEEFAEEIRKIQAKRIPNNCTERLVRCVEKIARMCGG